jgi:diguanylate cyclase (GGDEF)-like protein/PAS domain S-box-containing protein
MSENLSEKCHSLPDRGERSSQLGKPAEPTQTIDLSRLFTKDLTESGSFNLYGVRESVVGKLLNAVPVPAGLIGGDYCFTFCNEAWQKLSIEPVKLEGRSFLTIFCTPEEASVLKSTVDKVYEERRSLVQESRILLSECILWVRLCFRPLRLGGDQVVLVTVEDLTLEKEKSSLLKTIERIKKEWERTVDSVKEIIAIVDDRYMILRANKALSVRVGLPVRDVVGQHCFRLIHGTDGPPSYCPMARSFSEEREIAAEYYEPNLSAFFAEAALPICGDSPASGARVITLEDITERKRAEEELHSRANNDELTGLYNRRHLREILAGICETARRYGHPLSLGMLDLDNLKKINDRHGHEGGDQVLKWVGSLIQQSLRVSDSAGRYGGDEFVIIFPHTPAEGASECVARILSNMQKNSFHLGAEAYTVTCSAGISSLTSPEMTVDDLIRHADRALYAAKRKGRNCIVVERTDKPTVVGKNEEGRSCEDK